MAGETAQAGAIKTITDIEEVPLKMLESILEGMAKDPKSYIALGLGFYIGYEGYDVLKWFMSNMRILRVDADAADVATSAALGVASFVPGAVDVGKIVLFPWLSGLQVLFGAATEAEAAAAQETPDDKKTDAEKKWAEVKARLLLGSFGALTAMMLTQPGFLGGVGEIIKGIGEIVPG